MSIFTNISSLFGVASIEFIPGTEYTAIYTYSLTNNFGYPAEHPDTGIVTKSITWTLKSSLPISGGTFVDGTPWVANNGDIRLYSVSPVSTSYEAKGPTLESGRYFFDANNTVINPDLGKVIPQPMFPTTGLYDQHISGTSKLYRSNGETANTESGRLFPFDGRGGKVYPPINNASPYYYGSSYDSTQKWSGVETKLNTGDLVITTISHNRGLSYFNGVDVTLASQGGSIRIPMIDMFGALTCIGPTFATIANNCFRPPANWDPLDRVNAPILQEVDDCSGYTFNYPNYDFDGPKTWNDNDTIRTLFNSSADYQKYGSISFLHAGADQLPAYGHALSWSDSSYEYGDSAAIDIEVQLIAAFDAGITADIRNKLRRVIAQRGIDIYGAHASSGKCVYPAAGVSTNYYGYMPLAYLTTRHPGIYDILNMTSIGNTANGTFINFENSFLGEEFYYGHIGQYFKYPETIAQTNFTHPSRWQGLEIAGISSGATYQIIFVKPPTNTPLGSVVTNIDGTTFIHGWTSSSLYSKSDATYRWNMKDNTVNLQSDAFMSGYVQNEARGSTFISRIIKSTGTTGYPNAGWKENTTSVPGNGIQIFYLRSDIFEGDENYCNLSPYVQEDIQGKNIYTIVDSGGSFQWWWAYQHSWQGLYAFAVLSLMIPYAIFYHGISAAGISMPRYVEETYLAQKYKQDNKWGRISGKASLNTTYDLGFNTTSRAKSHDALVRLYYLNGATGATTGNAIDMTPFRKISTGIRSEFPPDETNWSWIGFSAAPNNITIVGNSINTTNNPTSFYIAGSTVAVGRLRDFKYRDTPDGKFSVYYRNDVSPNTISYNTYLKNKILYIWFSGASKPIGLTLGNGTTVANDTTYTQYWVRADGKNNFHDLVPRFSNALQYRVFFADPY